LLSENLKGTTLRKPRHRCEDIVGMDLFEIWWESVNWMHFAEDKGQWQALVTTVMNLQVP
jgi:hypothetical protein